MFYFQQLLNQGLSGIDRTAILPTITTIAYTILLVGFMVSLYQAAMRGGDVQALGVAAIKYLMVAIILANWTTVFHEINNAFIQIAQYIANSSNAGDMFSAWLSQLKEQFNGNVFSSLWKLITGGFAVLITVLLMICAYIVFAVALVVFGFFYTLYGCVLYVVGPLVIALLPMAGLGGLGSSFATNLFIWNSWAVLYALFGSLITAIHMNEIDSMFSTGFAGFFVGTLDSLVLGIVSIFYAAAILLIPKIAKSIVAGNVGVTVSSLARTGGAIAATAISVIAGASAGGAAGSGSGAGAGASGGSGAGAGASAGGGAGAADGVTSSSSPPPQPSMADTISSGFKSAVGGDAPASPSNGSGDGSSMAKSSNGKGPDSSGGSSSSTQATNSERSQPLYRGSVVQTVAFHAARATSQLVHKATAGQSSDKEEENTNGKRR